MALYHATWRSSLLQRMSETGFLNMGYVNDQTVDTSFFIQESDDPYPYRATTVTFKDSTPWAEDTLTYHEPWEPLSDTNYDGYVDDETALYHESARIPVSLYSENLEEVLLGWWALWFMQEGADLFTNWLRDNIDDIDDEVDFHFPEFNRYIIEEFQGVPEFDPFVELVDSVSYFDWDTIVDYSSDRVVINNLFMDLLIKTKSQTDYTLEHTQLLALEFVAEAMQTELIIQSISSDTVLTNDRIAMDVIHAIYGGIRKDNTGDQVGSVFDITYDLVLSYITGSDEYPGDSMAPVSLSLDGNWNNYFDNWRNFWGYIADGEKLTKLGSYSIEWAMRNSLTYTDFTVGMSPSGQPYIIPLAKPTLNLTFHEINPGIPIYEPDNPIHSFVDFVQYHLLSRYTIESNYASQSALEIKARMFIIEFINVAIMVTIGQGASALMDTAEKSFLASFASELFEETVKEQAFSWGLQKMFNINDYWASQLGEIFVGGSIINTFSSGVKVSQMRQNNAQIRAEIRSLVGRVSTSTLCKNTESLLLNNIQNQFTGFSKEEIAKHKGSLTSRFSKLSSMGVVGKLKIAQMYKSSELIDEHLSALDKLMNTLHINEQGHFLLSRAKSAFASSVQQLKFKDITEVYKNIPVNVANMPLVKNSIEYQQAALGHIAFKLTEAFEAGNVRVDELLTSQSFRDGSGAYK
ncbi:MAG: hypothetical protein E4G98_06870, partial [Promethearchaeota archaeon]